MSVIQGTMQTAVVTTTETSAVAARSVPLSPISQNAGLVVPSQRSGTNLWEVAANELAQEELEYLNSSYSKGETWKSILLKIKLETEQSEERWKNQRLQISRANKPPVILREKIDRILLVVTKFIQVGDSVMQYDPGHAALPWAAVRFVLQVVVNEHQAFDLIVEGLERISSLISRYAIFEALYLNLQLKSYPGLERALTVLYVGILKFLAQAKKFYRKGTMNRLAATVIKDDRRNFESLYQSIVDKEAEVDRFARLAEAEKSSYNYRDLANLLSQVSVDVASIRLELQTTKHASPSKFLPAPERSSSFSRGEVLKWVSDINVSLHHKTVCRDRLKDSGLWLLERPEFVQWVEDDSSSILWLTGIPGSGKTKLLSVVIDHFLRGPENQLAYFYCFRSPGELERGNAEDTLRSILRQLSSPSSASPVWEPLQQKYEGLQDQGLELNKLSLDDTRDFIKDLSEQHPSIIIVIDAVDECNADKRSELLDALNCIVDEAQHTVKIMVSSRDDGNLASQLGNATRIRVLQEDTANDIRRFVTGRIGTEIQKKRLLRGEVSPALKEHVIRTLVDGAHGMFSWVALQIQRLCRDKMITERDIRDQLQHLPPGLKDTYSAIYQQITTLPGIGSQNTALRALKLLLCAQKPLTTGEFLAAASFESRTKFNDVSNQAMLDMCCNLVVFDDQMGVFRFAHLSAREYLEERETDAIAKAHALTAEICLVFCLYSKSDFETPGKSLCKGKAFQEYATLHWATHYQMSGNCVQEGNLRSLFHQLISANVGSDQSPFADYIQSAHRYVQRRPKSDPVRTKIESVFSSPPNPLFLACAWGFAEIVEARLNHALTAKEAVNQRGQTGLHIACEYGQLSIVQLLLDHGADINTKSRDGSTPLHGASEKGKVEVVRCLLEKGVNVGAIDKSSKTALHNASTMGDEATVQLLLEYGAPHMASDKRGWTPLHCASYMGHEGVIQMLLQRKADVETQDDFGCTALYLASEQGHEQVVDLLVGKGAIVDTIDASGSSPLCQAIEKGHDGVIQLLLRSGASVHGHKAVHAAAERGAAEILKLLITKGADIESTDERGMRALHQASISGHVDVVQLLLDNDAIVNPEDENGCSPLYMSVVNGHEEVVKLFLSKGASVNVPAANSKIPLHEAAHRDYARIVQRLVEGGSDLAARDNTGRTAIHYAALVDTELTMRYLLEKGDDDERMDNLGRTAWHWAAKEGGEAIVKLLFEKRGSVFEGTDNYGMTALDLAIEMGYDKVADVLIQDVFFDAEAQWRRSGTDQVAPLNC